MGMIWFLAGWGALGRPSDNNTNDHNSIAIIPNIYYKRGNNHINHINFNNYGNTRRNYDLMKMNISNNFLTIFKISNSNIYICIRNILH